MRHRLPASMLGSGGCRTVCSGIVNRSSCSFNRLLRLTLSARFLGGAASLGGAGPPLAGVGADVTPATEAVVFFCSGNMIVSLDPLPLAPRRLYWSCRLRFS